MKLQSVALFALLGSAMGNVLQLRATCNADNCARAVTGTSSGIKPSVSVRRADCSSFMRTTITPVASTVTITVTPTTDSTTAILKRDNLQVRQVTVAPSSVPTYASACSGISRYSSACACWNITATTSYAPTPTVTTTVTLSPTSSCSNPGVCGTYQNCGDRSDCYCGYDTSNNAICFQSEACDENLQCSSNADCQPDESCLRDNCCGFNICSPIIICANPGAPSRLFMPRGAALVMHNVGLRPASS